MRELLKQQVADQAPDAGAILGYALATFHHGKGRPDSFLAPPGTSTLPVEIYTSIRKGFTPEINAISTIIVAVVSIALLIGWRLGAFRTNKGSIAVEDAPAA